MIYRWWAICLDCGHNMKEDVQYISFSKLYCAKCSSRHLKSGFICESNGEAKEPDVVPFDTKI